jgi:hypothetical protein
MPKESIREIASMPNLWLSNSALQAQVLNKGEMKILVFQGFELLSEASCFWTSLLSAN